MDTPGRPSTASMTVVALVPGRRPAPPPHLNARQAELWSSIAATKPHDWWTPDNFGIFAAYVKAIDEHERTAACIERLDPVKDMAVYEKLGKLTISWANTVTKLAGQMRLTQKSRVTDRQAGTQHKKTAQEQKKPWE